MPYNPNYGLAPYFTQAPVLTDVADIEEAFNYFYYGQSTATSTPPASSLYGWLQNLQTQITTLAGESKGAGNVEPGPNPPTVTPAGDPVPNGWVWVNETAPNSFYQYNASAIWSEEAPTENLALGLLWIDSNSAAPYGDLAGYVIQNTISGQTGFSIINQLANQRALVVQAAPSSIANILEVRNSAGTVINGFGPDGKLIQSQSVVIVNQNTNYTLTVNDNNKVFVMNSSGSLTLSIPSGTFESGFCFGVIQRGTGKINIASGAGSPTLISSNGTLTRAQNSVIGALWIAANTWVVFGDNSTV